MIRESIEYLQELDNYEPYNAEFDNGVKQYRRQVISHISDSTAVDNASNNNATPTTNDDTAQAHHSAENFFADIKQALEANDYQAAFRHETAMLDQYFDDETVLGNLLVLKLEHLAEHETTQYSHNSDAIYLLLPETPQTYIANFAKGANLATRIDQGEIHLITKAIYYIKNALKLNSKSNTCKNMLKILGEKLSLETNFFKSLLNYAT
ncbi:MAG: hypothetical protein HWD59_10505 [Coxiellaceae bacterium]|nr:MAG: hypothetical protein HWD59_10505 [Coxiellaceae bacterium]